MRERKNNGSRTLFTIFVAFVVVVAIAELTTRLFFASNTVFNINIGAFRDYHPTRGTQLKKGYKGGGMSINSHGILGPEFEIEPDPRAVRILTIGNSVAFSPPERNYGRVLEDELESVFGDERIEVIVGAVPGYSSYEALDWYDEFLHRLKADITIVYLGWNDMGQFHPWGLRYKNEGLYRERTLLGRLMENLYLMRVPYFLLGRMEQRQPVDLSPLTPEEIQALSGFTPTHFENNLTSLITRARGDGSDVYLIELAGLITNSPTQEELERMHFPRNMHKKLAVYQAVYEKYASRLDEVARSTATPLIDASPLIKTPEQRRIFTDTVHWNEEGAQRVGEYLAELLRPTVAERLATKTP